MSKATETQVRLDLLRRRFRRNEEHHPVVQDIERDEGQDLLGYLFTILSVLRKRFWPIIIISSIFAVVIYKWRSSKPKLYRASAMIEVSPRAPKVFTNIRDVISYHRQVRRFYSTQRAIISSRTIAKKALSKIRWVLDSPDFYGIDPKKEKISKEKLKKLQLAAPDILKKRVKVKLLEKSSIFLISISDTNPERAKELIRAVIQSYKEFNQSFRLRSIITAYDEIKKQKDIFEKRLAKIRTKLIQFRQRYNLLTASLDDRRNLAFKRLEALNKRYIQVMLNRISLESQLRPFSINNPKKLETFPPLLDNKLYWILKKKISELQLQRESLLTRYKPLHPKVQKVERKLKRLKEIIEGQLFLIFNNYRQQLDEARREERALRRMVAQAKVQFRQLEKLNLIYDQIRQKEQTLKRSLELLNRRYFELQILKDSTSTNVRVIEEPKTPDVPYYPKPKRDAAVAFVLSFSFIFFVFYLIEVLDKTIKTPEDIEKKVGIIALGEIPLFKFSQPSNKKERVYKLYDPNKPQGPLAESIRTIRTNLLFMSRGEGELQRILITSPMSFDGKTFVSINIAISLAHTGRKTLIVDTDMRRPRVHKGLDIQYNKSKGISTVIVGRSELEESVIKTKYPNLWLLPCGPIPPNPAELLQSNGFVEFLRKANEMFDILVFDSPPTMAVSDPIIISPLVDGVIFVCSSGSTPWTVLKKAVKKIEGVGGRVLGCILNKFSAKYRSSYYYRYGYGSYGYRYYSYGSSDDEV